MKQKQAILDALDGLPIETKISILANVFVSLGCSEIAVQAKSTVQIKNPEELWQLLLDHRRQHGETLATALLEQGIVMDSWLNE